MHLQDKGQVEHCRLTVSVMEVGRLLCCLWLPPMRCILFLTSYGLGFLPSCCFYIHAVPLLCIRKQCKQSTCMQSFSASSVTISVTFVYSVSSLTVPAAHKPCYQHTKPARNVPGRTDGPQLVCNSRAQGFIYVICRGQKLP